MDSKYWADQIAEIVIRQRGNKKEYSMQGGVSPSARKHIGSARELVTVDFVRKALEKRGKKVNFYYSWDSFDRLKKISKSIPTIKRKKIEKYVGTPTAFIPDPYGKHKSYAEHFEKILEKEIDRLGVKPKWLYQDKEYRSCKYWKLISVVLQKREQIRNILNKYRDHKLPKGWWPVRVYCEKCKNGDNTEILCYDGHSSIEYSCSCGYKGKMNFSRTGMIKPTWRVDWAMRWAYYDIDFEPSGKDHMVAGSSYDTSSEIVREIFGKEPPVAIMYEFVGKKGLDAKMSASAGDIITATDVLEVYPKYIARWFFAGTKPKKPFVIPFDEEFLKAYEDFYFTERIYYGKEKVSKRDEQHWKRVYEMCTEPSKKMPVQPTIRTCIEFVNIFQDSKKAADRYSEFMKAKKTDRVEEIMVHVKNWLDKHADDKYKFKIQSKPKTAGLKANEKQALRDLAEVLKKKMTEKQLFNQFYNIAEKNDLKAMEFFRACYKAIVNKERGPRLAPFILAVGQNKIRKLLENIK